MTRAHLSPLLAVALLACAGPSAKQRRGAEIHHDLAVEALRAGRAQEALREYDEALRQNPRFPDAYLGRGLVLEFGFGKLNEAERDYRQALALRPEYPEAHNNLGQLLAKTGRTEQAMAEFDAALADMMYREPWVARCNKGLALWRSGRKEEGLAELRNCVTLSPRYCAGRRDLGQVLLGEGRIKEALDQLTAYAQLCNGPDAQLQLATARMKAGDGTGAREALEKCLELGQGKPEGEECARSLALLK
ncbi:MAG TPA: tetratricopeptide repeat protein [Anaeromyxobacter sp.]|nr:tetratricopeptide repeat protein [Anaeromyxobacter sp.]